MRRNLHIPFGAEEFSVNVIAVGQYSGKTADGELSPVLGYSLFSTRSWEVRELVRTASKGLREFAEHVHKDNALYSVSIDVWVIKWHRLQSH